MREGRKIDLTGCNYGETTGPLTFLKRPTNYYYFLAGLVRSRGMTRILEIGTHFGGAIMSMSRGLSEEGLPKSKLVTVDIERKNQDGFKEYSHIRHITGDSLDKDVVERVAECFEGPIDLIYIDSLHEYGHTKENIDTYGKRLRPQYIVLDDIRQCDSMRKLWSALTREFKERAFDASDITVRKGAGFGVIYPFPASAKGHPE
jgi:predicted O-methyltransferase YrrM